MGATVVCGEVNSKNSFGGYADFTSFISAGSADSTWLESDVKDFQAVWDAVC
jgi:hypothetical protein